MATWTVELPVTGRAVIEVEAEDEMGAIDAALDQVSSAHLEEWEALRTISEGNVLHAMHPWDASAERHEDED